MQISRCLRHRGWALAWVGVALCAPVAVLFAPVAVIAAPKKADVEKHSRPPAKAAAADNPIAAARRVDQLLAAERPSAEASKSEPAKPADAWADAPTPSGADQKRASRAPVDAQRPMVDDETFIRRATLDLLGAQPTPEEITAFLLDPAAQKRGELVDRLLANPGFGHNWGRYWRDVILYRRSDDRALLMSGTLVNYLTDEFNRNAPWDEIARAFITGTGEIKEHGQTAIVMAQQASPEDTTAEVSRIFLGIQIQCAQCHNHPTDRWKREQFHELASFFTRVAVRRAPGADQRTFRVVSDDRGLGPRAPGASEKVQLEHHMPDLQDPQAEGKIMRPVFFATGQKLELGASDQERRETLARWITAPSDPYFAEAFVNRMWSELVGHGFVEPVDDMGPDRPAMSPETLKYLGSQFAAHRYDVKWLFRTIMASEAYQRQSRSRSETADPLATSCPQRLRADQLANSLLDALGVDESKLRGGMDAGERGRKEEESSNKGSGKTGGGKTAKLASSSVKAVGEFRKPANSADGPKRRALGQSPRGQAQATFGYDPSTKRDEVAGTIPQALWLMNGALVNQGTDGSGSSALAKLLASESNDEAVATELYLRCLAREPKPAELRTCLEHVHNVGRQEGFEDVLWSLLNATEFLYRR